MISESKIKKLEEELKKRNLLHLIDKKIKEFYGLITRNIAIELIAYEKGLISFEKKISELKEGSKNFVLIAYVKKIFSPVKLNQHTFRDIVIYDDTGEITLRLWDEYVNFRIKAGDKIRITHGYMKFGRIGISKIGNITIEEFSKPIEVYECEDGLVPLLTGIYKDGFLESKGAKLKINLDIEKNTKIILENVEVKNGVILLKPFSRIFAKKT